jgi:uncharacterized protein (DUF983 family)
LAAPPAGAQDGEVTSPIRPAAAPTRMLGRALLKHCAVCNQGHLFRRWFRMLERCPRCGLRFERIEGHWSGDLGINTIVSFGALFLTLIIGFAVTYPDVPGVALFLASVTVALVVPLVFFPYSKTIWLAIDLMMRPLEAGEVDPRYLEPGSQ